MIDPDDIQGSLWSTDINRDNAVGIHMSPVQIQRFKGPEWRLQQGAIPKDSVQKFGLFCASCAGKNSHQQAAKLVSFEEELWDVVYEKTERQWDKYQEMVRIIGSGYIFNVINALDGHDHVSEAIKRSKLGKWSLLAPGFKAMATDPDFPGKLGDRLDKVEKYAGYGIKTASLFNMHVFHEECACLDTYILRWLAGDAMFHDAPIDILPPSYKGVPRQSISKWDIYERWEDAFLSQCVKRGMSSLELDKQIWIHARIKTEKPKINQGELTL